MGREESRFRNAKAPEIPFFPDFLLRELIAWYGVLAVLGTLAALFPWDLGVKADAFAPAPAGIRPEWYFLAPFYTLKLIPGHVLGLEGEFVGLLGFGLLALAWVSLPLWAVNRDGSLRRKLVAGAGVTLLAYLSTFSLLRLLAMRYALMLLLAGCRAGGEGLLSGPAIPVSQGDFQAAGGGLRIQRPLSRGVHLRRLPRWRSQLRRSQRRHERRLTDSSARPLGPRFPSFAPGAIPTRTSCASTTPGSAWTSTANI